MKPRPNAPHLSRRVIGVILALLLLSAVPIYLIWRAPSRAVRAEAHRHELAAAAALKAGDDEMAESELIQAITIWPGDTAAYSRLGDYYLAHGEPEVAGVAYHQLLEQEPNYPHVYCRLAEAADDFGSEESARSYAEQELKRDPQCVRALDLLAVKDRSAGNQQKARAEAEKAYRVAPNDLKAVIIYAESWLPNEPDRAAAILQQARKVLPQSWLVVYDLGFCHAHGAGGPASLPLALTELRQAAAMNPQMGVIHKELCRLLLLQGRVAEAAQEGALAVRYSPFDRQSRLYYAQSLQQAGRRAEADKAFNQFKEIETAAEDRSALQKRYGNLPQDPAVAVRLAACERKLGDDRAALRVLEAALTAHPDDPQLRQEVARLTTTGKLPQPETMP